ncbi:cation:proton antiporter [Streptomyces sp. NPDC046261]|uniref:cation:proton antiporter n=1 Tax=Streptomyces sp. NPDC046261 TaxID=3157200 RepID=UPI0033D927A1
MHHTTALYVELGAVILGLGLLGRLAGRLGFSPIPLYLLAGLAFGRGGIAPLSASESFVSTGAEIGVTLLLLLLGLEYSASELTTSLKTQYPSGAMDFVLNAVPGALAAVLLGWGTAATVAMAGITWVSSSGVVAKVLTDLGHLGSDETAALLGVLIIEDLAMAIYLPLLTTLLAGGSPAEGGFTLLIALATVCVVFYTAVRHGRIISRAVSSDNPEMLLLMVLGLTFCVAGAVQELHVSAAVGAFLIGVALSDDVAEGAYHRLVPLRDLFAAVFFVFFGLNTDPADIPPVLVPALLLAAFTALTKLATGWYAARRAGIGSAGRWQAGAALIARGEFSIVIAGLAAGAAPGIGPLAAAYVAILIVLGPLCMRWFGPRAHPLTRSSPIPPSDDAPAGDGSPRTGTAPPSDAAQTHG